MGQSRMEKPETQATLSTRDRTNTNKTKNTTKKTKKNEQHRSHQKTVVEPKGKQFPFLYKKLCQNFYPPPPLPQKITTKT